VIYTESHFWPRQLNLYNYQRVTEGPDKGSYYHELFARDRPFLCTMMKRTKIKGDKRVDAATNGVNKPHGGDAQDDVDSEHENLEDESQDE
jgi:hypothetical protein